MTRSASKAARTLVGGRVTTPSEAASIADEWDALAAGRRAGPFGLPEVALPWWESLGKGELRVATARSASGELVGLFAGHARRIGGFEIVRPLGHGVGAVASTLVAPVKADVAGVLLDALLDGPRSVVHLADVPLDDPLVVHARRAGPEGGRSLRATLHDTCPVIGLGGAQGAADLLARPDHRNLRKMLARLDRDAAGRAVAVDVARTPAEVAVAFDAVGELYDAAEAANPRAHFGRGSLGTFFRSALQRLADHQRVALLTLLVDGAPAAFDVYVRHRDVASAVLGRYHPRFADVAPGHLLLRGGVDWAIDAGVATIDLQLGADHYKTTWSNGSVDTFEVLIGPSGRLGAAAAAVRSVEEVHRLRGRILDRVAR